MGKPLDYKIGSSDYPYTGGPISLRSKRSALERKLDDLNIKILKADKSVATPETNKLRLKRAISHNLPIFSTRIEKGKTHYRVVEIDSQGLVNIKYEPSMPTKLEALTNDEVIPIRIATEYLNIDKKDLYRISEGRIRFSGPYVNLNDINKFKFNLVSNQTPA